VYQLKQIEAMNGEVQYYEYNDTCLSYEFMSGAMNNTLHGMEIPYRLSRYKL